MEGRQTPLIPLGAAEPPLRVRTLRRLGFWAFLGALWSPALAFLAAPALFAFVPAARSPWLVVPWAVSACLVAVWIARSLRLARGRTPAAATPAPGAKRSVAVIGAGPAGLAAVKELKAAGADVVCFERGAGLGGVFRFDAEMEGGVWPGTRLTSSPWVTAFSDFPPETGSSRQWLAEEYLAYLERYADHFGLREHLRFGWTVERVTREAGAVRLRATHPASGETIDRTFDHVALCTGVNLHPRAPSIEGIDALGGEVLHVARYKGPEPFRGKKVVVVGLGESAADIAHELAGVSESVHLSLRRGKFVIPRRNPLNGIANDYDTNRVRYATPIVMRNLYMRFKRRSCEGTAHMDARSRLRMQFLEASGAGPMSQPATKSDEFLDDVLAGRVAVRGAIARCTPGKVHYEDGTSEEADAILFGTGYRPHFPMLDPGDADGLHPANMFMSVVVPEWGTSLVFIGCARPAIGAIPPCGGIQARWFAQLVTGGARLPSKEEMARAIAEARAANRMAFPLLDQPNVLVQWIPYLDAVAELIGCRPSPRRLLASPRLAYRTMTGPMTGAMYRLDGPGAAPELAAKTILSLRGTFGLFELFTHALLHFYASMASLVARDRRLAASNSFV